MNVESLLSERGREIATEAAYYAVRVLKQSSLPTESQKEHFEDASGSQPTAEARVLAQEIIAWVERVEGRRLSQIPPEKRFAYVERLMRATDKLTLLEQPTVTERGAQLLDELRRG